MIVYLARALRNGIIKRKSRRETQRERERTCLRLEEFGSEFDYLNSYQFLKKLFKEEEEEEEEEKEEEWADERVGVRNARVKLLSPWRRRKV